MKMAQIRYSSGDLHRYRSEPADDALPVTASSVREQILQQCLRRFYEKHSSVSHYTGNKNQFTPSSTFNDDSEEKLSGLISCDELKKKLKSSETRRIFASADLNQEEISLLLEICGDTSERSVSSQITEASDQESRSNLSLLRVLLEKLSRNSFTDNNPQPEQFKDVLMFESKREFEAAVRDGVVDRELHCQRRAAGQAFTGDVFVKVVAKKRPAVHPDHPLNHLADIDAQLFSKKKKSCNEHENNAGKTTPDLDTRSKISMHSSKTEGDPTESSLQSASGAISCDRSRGAKSQWDVRKSEHVLSVQRSNSGKESGMPTEEKKIELSKEFILLPRDNDLLPIPLIEKHCVPSDELLREFPQYSRGVPNKTLYLKNLHRRVTPNELVSLFGHFDTGHERATYRLLSGRMRGQAFVKFPNVSAAAAALETCLGFRLKGKPLVIQYGKHN